MGQRSQIFVRYEDNGQKKIIARYYQWNYAERMISRARYGIEWLKEMYKYSFEIERKLYRILDTNFDMIDCVISSDIIKDNDDGDFEVLSPEDAAIKDTNTDDLIKELQKRGYSVTKAGDKNGTENNGNLS